MGEIRGTLEAGILEIYRYVPENLIRMPVGEMDLDEFARHLARARYLEEVEVNLYKRAIVEVFEDN